MRRLAAIGLTMNLRGAVIAACRPRFVGAFAAELRVFAVRKVNASKAENLVTRR